MQLDRISTALRLRTPWEAIDLGTVMARQAWWRLTSAWLAVSLPPFLVLQWLLPDHPLWVITIVWWLKPLWERAPLHILSHSLFGEVPSLRQTLKAFPALASKQWLASLTWRRLSPTRAMDLPVVQLENLAGAQRAKRLAVLHRTLNDGSTLLTALGSAMELLLNLAVLMMLYLLIPNEWSHAWRQDFAGGYERMSGLYNFLYYAAMALVGPFYVAGGFALYLNRRTWLEAWDIELGFRRLLQRVSTAGALPAVLALLGAMLVGAGPWMLPAASAAEPIAMSREAAKDSIQAILAGEDYHQKKVLRTPRLPDWWHRPNNVDIPGVPEWFTSLVQWIARSAEFILWGTAVVLILLVAHKYRDWLFRFGERSGQAAAQASRADAAYAVLRVKEPLPRDVLAEVTRLWNAQQYRPALALLYRATLLRVMEGYGLTLRESCTEQECMRLVAASVPPELSGYFNELTVHWQRLAYAHRPPAAVEVEDLCRRWQGLFEAGERG